MQDWLTPPLSSIPIHPVIIWLNGLMVKWCLWVGYCNGRESLRRAPSLVSRNSLLFDWTCHLMRDDVYSSIQNYTPNGKVLMLSGISWGHHCALLLRVCYMSICPVHFNSGSGSSICTTCLATWKQLHNYEERLFLSARNNLLFNTKFATVLFAWETREGQINMSEIFVACRVCV